MTTLKTDNAAKAMPLVNGIEVVPASLARELETKLLACVSFLEGQRSMTIENGMIISTERIGAFLNLIK